MYIPVLLGTGRAGRRSEHVAHFVIDLINTSNKFETNLIDVLDFVSSVTIEPEANHEISKRWSEIMTRADGLIIVTPEYNKGYPGELKILLDKIYKEYERKPVGICGVSNGNWGGSRAVEALKLTMLALKMVPLNVPVYFPNVGKILDDSGKIVDETYVARVNTLIDEIFWYADAMKSKREK